MVTATTRALKPTRSRVLTAVVILAILFGCYGLLTAQQARSTTTLTKKVLAVVDGTSGALIRGSHALSSSKDGTGD
jgi:hypothetical protein